GWAEHTFVAARQQRAIDAEREADAGRGWTAEILDEAVVAAATPERVLGGIERAALELERRAAVIVEPAHEPHVGRVRDREVVEPGPHGREGGSRVGRPELVDRRRGGDDRDVLAALGIEHAQRVLVERLAALLGQRVAGGLEVATEGVDV